MIFPTFTITNESAGQRLDSLCAEYWKVSRQKVKTWIQKGWVKRNGKNFKPSDRGQLGDCIAYEMIREHLKPEILITEKDYLVLNKKAGELVHSTLHHPGLTSIADWLKERYGELPSLSTEKGRGGIIHRLDQPTSGLLIVGLTEKGVNHFGRLFAERRIVKLYLSLHVGAIPHDLSVLDSYLEKDPIHPSKKISRHIPMTSRFKKAITHVYILSQNERATLVLSRPLTGRNHQIRAQWAGWGYPLIGDTLYGGEKASRLALHACGLIFQDPDKRKIQLISEPDKHFKNLIQSLKIEVDNLSYLIENVMKSILIKEDLCL